MTQKDPHSFSRPEKRTVQHIDLDLEIDFDAERILGCATLQLTPSAENMLVLDTKGLDIKKVTTGPLEYFPEYSLGEETEYLGRPLSITLPSKANFVHIEYIASGHSGALQWLRPTQTTGGVSPFLFTQSQTIGARTWIPCQDTPSVRTTFHARVKVPQGLIAVMSAENKIAKNSTGIFEFNCSYPIPSYLFALAVGDLDYRVLSPRSVVFAEPSIVSQAAWEFEEIESMINVAEKLYGPYRWKRFDIVVLPPSFPLGGMENPQLIFVTPTLLTGDRSLISLIAHELAHSWSGNLVTNATWNDFWINEGFAVYTEHRIMEEIYGKDYDDMLSLLSLRTLKKALVTLSPNDTSLKLDLIGRHPDDCFTEIPYEKGYFFLRMLEEKFGRERWDKFLHKYFDKFAFQSIDSSEFLTFLREELLNGDVKLTQSLSLEEWVYVPGLPQNCPTISSSELERVEVEIQRIEKGTPAGNLSTTEWTTHHWIYFLSNLTKPFSKSLLDDLDNTFGFSNTKNAEIMCQWLLLCIGSEYENIDFALKPFLIRNGRMKYIKALYSELIKSSEGRNKAHQIYKLARPNYHSAAVRIVDEMLVPYRNASIKLDGDNS